MKEREFENLIRDYLNENNIYHFKYWGGNLKTSSGNFVKTKVGVPDLICNINGIFVGLEVKQENGKTSDIQISNIIQINKTGGLAFLVYPKDFIVLKTIIQNILKDNSKENIKKQRELYFNITKNISKL